MTTAITKKTITPEREQEFIFYLKSDDERHFSILYDRFSAAVFGLILKWVKDTGAAENLMQDVFVKAWRNRHLYDSSKGRIFTWLYNISRNVFIDHLRSKAYKKNKVSILTSDLTALVPVLDFSPDTIGLRALVKILRNEEKEVLELMYFKGMTQKEIAELKEIPIGTVKTRISRAIKSLRHLFFNDRNNSLETIFLN